MRAARDGRISRAAAAVLLGLIAAYRVVISPLLGPRCRFYPSCSAYTTDVIRSLGPWRGAWLGLRRVARCHPLHPGGYDPAPTAVPARSSRGT